MKEYFSSEYEKDKPVVNEIPFDDLVEPIDEDFYCDYEMG
jgi:hypothetical protein